MEINYTTSGFMKDAAYSAHLYGILKEYDDKFEGLELLNLELIEILPELAEKLNTKIIDFSDDKKVCILRIEKFQYRDNKGRINGKPLPFEVFETIRFVLGRAVKEYNELTQ